MRALVRPFVVFAIGVVAAIWGGLHVASPSTWVVLPAATGAIAAFVATRLAPHTALRRAAIGLAGGCVGVLLLALHTASEPDPSELTQRIGDGRIRGVVRGTVTDGPRLHERGWIWNVDVESIDGQHVADDGGRVRLFAARPDHVRPDRTRPLPGDTVRLFARLERYPGADFPERASFRRSMRHRSVVARGIVHDRIHVSGLDLTPTRALDRVLTWTRMEYERLILTHLTGDRAAVALAMTVASRGLLGPDTWEPFRETGTAHLLAISGLHLGVLAALLWGLLGWLVERWPRPLRRWGRRRSCGCAVIGMLGLYVLAIGAPVSAVRAWLMVLGTVAALLVLRPFSGFHVLAAAALGIVALRPRAVGGLGFQLSFAATFAILCFLRRRPRLLKPPDDPTEEESRYRRWGRRIGTGIGVSLSATLATWPVVLAWYGEVPVHALWLNLVVPPLVSSCLFPLLCAGALLAPIVPSLGTALLAVASEGMLQLGALLSHVADWPGALLGPGTWPTASLGCIALGVFTWICSRLQPRPLVTGSVLILLGAGLGWTLGAAPEGSGLRIEAVPVGQGDALLVTTPRDRHVLIDAGGSRFGDDPGRAVVSPYLTRLGIDRLDWVVATHADVDHIGGLGAVVDQHPPRHVVYDRRENSPKLRRLVGSIAARGARVHPVARRLEVTVGECRVEIVRPRPSMETSDNDGSLVVRITWGDATVLLPGDVERAGEAWLLEHVRLEADLLKVPHHGSATSSTDAFLEAVDPEVAFVSAGRFNAFGHPAPSVVRRYRRRGVRLFRTARHGLLRAELTRDGGVTVHVRRFPR